MGYHKDKLMLKCWNCGTEYPWSFTVQCPKPECKNALVDIQYNLKNVKILPEGPQMERFFDLLPISSREYIIDGGDGNTPCVHAKELGKALGGFTQLYMKLETENPTKTTKDRMGAQGVATLRDLGIKKFITSSTGNSCTSLARIVSRFPDMHMSIFVGDEFLKRLNWVGAKNVTVYWLRNGTFVDAHAAAKWFSSQSDAVSERGFFFFGKRESLKTAYFEAVDQIPRPIESYVQGISSAMGLFATYQGAQQYLGIGKIQRMPKMIGVQEETCNPLVKAFERGVEPMDRRDIIPYPRGLSKSTLRGDPSMVYRYVRHSIVDSGGTMLSAEQDAMREMQVLARETEGVDMCHTATMTLVGVKKLLESGFLRKDEVIMLNITGADRKGAPHPQPDYMVEKDGDTWKISPAGDTSTVGCLERVMQVLSQAQKLPPETELDTETKLIGGGLALDSVALLELSLALEKEFGMPIAEDELKKENFETVGDVADMFRRKRSEQSTSAG